VASGQEFHCYINTLPFPTEKISIPVGIYVPGGLVPRRNGVSLKVLDEAAATGADGSPLVGLGAGSSIVKRLEQNMEERDLPNILANYCCDLLDWACEQGLTKDEALQVMRDVAQRGRVSDIRNTSLAAQARAAH
jgi:hypothetical protein